MLLKLLKYELKSSFKQIWPLSLGMVCLAIFIRFIGLPILNNSSSFSLAIFSGLLMLVFFIGILVLAVEPLIVNGARFKKSIFSNEGYLTMTLPVSVHELLISKLISNAIWCIANTMLFIFIGTILVNDFYPGTNEIINNYFMLDAIQLETYGKLFVIVLEIGLIYLAAISLASLIIYASYAIGYSINKHKTLLTIILIYVFFQLTSCIFIGSLVAISAGSMSLNGLQSGFTIVQIMLLAMLVVLIICCLIYYFLSYYFLTKKLNLE